MQLIRHGAHIPGQRTDARPGSGNARTATRLSSSARGATPPLGKAAALSSDVWHDLHASLTALGTDVIDLFLLHYYQPKCASPTSHGTTQPPHRRMQDNRDCHI